MPQLVHRVDGDRVVDHVRRRVALRGNEHVHAEAVLGMHPRTDVALHHSRPAGAPALERALAARVRDDLLDLADEARVVAIDRLLPLLVGIAEPVPVRGPRLGQVGRIAARPVRESVHPALGEMPLGVGLDVDGDILVHRRPQPLRLEVVERPAVGAGELERPGLRIGEDEPRDAAHASCRGRRRGLSRARAGPFGRCGIGHCSPPFPLRGMVAWRRAAPMRR